MKPTNLDTEQAQEECSREYWFNRLSNKEDNVDGYEEHAEVIAKYILSAYKQYPELTGLPNMTVYLKPIDWDNPIVLIPNLSNVLKKVYPSEHHAFRRALREATGFSWGWAFNIARFAAGLPPQPNPAITTFTLRDERGEE